MVLRNRYDSLPNEEQALHEVAAVALFLIQCKWWQFRRKRILKERIDLIRSYHALRPPNYFNFYDWPFGS